MPGEGGGGGLLGAEVAIGLPLLVRSSDTDTTKYRPMKCIYIMVRVVSPRRVII